MTFGTPARVEAHDRSRALGAPAGMVEVWPGVGRTAIHRGEVSQRCASPWGKTLLHATSFAAVLAMSSPWCRAPANLKRWHEERMTTRPGRELHSADGGERRWAALSFVTLPSSGRPLRGVAELPRSGRHPAQLLPILARGRGLRGRFRRRRSSPAWPAISMP